MRRASSTSSIATPWRRRRARRDRLGRGGSITCSSTPGSTCCRRRSIACSARGPRASIWASTYSTIDLAREVSAAEIARAEDEANRVVWEDRPVTIRFASRGRSRGAAAAEGVRARGHAAADRRRRASTCLPAAARTSRAPARSASSSCPRPSGLKAGRGSRSSAAAAPCTVSARFAMRSPAAPRLVGAPAELPAAFERLQGEGKDLRRQLKDFQGVSRRTRPTRWRTAEAVGTLRLVAATLAGWDVNAMKTIASRIVERAGHVVVLAPIRRPRPSWSRERPISRSTQEPSFEAWSRGMAAKVAAARARTGRRARRVPGGNSRCRARAVGEPSS